MTEPSILELYSRFNVAELQQEQYELQNDHFELQPLLLRDPLNQQLRDENQELIFSIRMIDRLIDMRQAGIHLDIEDTGPTIPEATGRTGGT